MPFNSQADSASSILVTRSAIKAQVGPGIGPGLHSCRSLLSLAVPVACPITFLGDVSTEGVRDLFVLLPGGVLVDQRGPRGAVTHAGHQVSEAGTSARGEGVSGMAQVVKVEPG